MYNFCLLQFDFNNKYGIYLSFYNTGLPWLHLWPYSLEAPEVPPTSLSADLGREFPGCTRETWCFTDSPSETNGNDHTIWGLQSCTQMMLMKMDLRVGSLAAKGACLLYATAVGMCQSFLS